MNLGVYIQVPFCQTKCTYCNFHTGVVSPDRYGPYAEAVCREIAASFENFRESVVDTIYLGGGTPSLLHPRDLDNMLQAVRSACTWDIAEATLEADPETISPEKASAWFEAGFNRISLGAQSFVDLELRASGRMHRREHIGKAVEILRGSGFRNASLDLIVGLPHQTAESWSTSLDELLAIRPEHISIYL
jgi:oxygen-independent coproporphyrinogen III oxidase